VTERLLIAVAFLAVIGIAGAIIRAAVASRSARLAANTKLETAGPRLLLFSGPDCAACDTQRRVIEASRDTWHQPVDVTYHDAVAEAELARKFGIVMVPAVVVANAEGRIVGVRQGLVDEDRLRSLIAAAA
jgi:thioredoxin-like negative regulator of GroEL